ncbi:MAG: hypothetical protein GX362_03915 [Methanosarcinaceae archaeon]|nr:hypothetical protein [Methanosarcinaceae archaeon]
MNKNQLIRLHADLVKIKLKMLCFEEDLVKEFDGYYDLSISPLHIHKSKGEHEHAIFVLLEHLLKVTSSLPASGASENIANVDTKQCIAQCPEYNDCENRCDKCSYMAFVKKQR